MSEVIEITVPNFLPVNLDAERAILGAILLDNKLFNDAASTLNVQDFHLSSHRQIFERMQDLSLNDRAIDMITLIEELDRKHLLGQIGDVAYVSSLVEGVPERPNIDQYIRITKEKSQLRQLFVRSKLAMEQIIDGEHANTVSAGLMQTLIEIETQAGIERQVRPEEFMPQVLKDVEKQSNTQGLIGLPTGLSNLDEVTGGLRAGELVIIGARPGVGKTVLAVQMSITNVGAEEPVPTGLFSLEMSRWDLGRRFLSAVSKVPAWKIRDPRNFRKDDPDWLNLLRVTGEQISKWPLYIDDNGSLTIDELIARAKMFISRFGVKLIVVDYLQLVGAPGLEPRERVSRVANALRILAKTERVAVVLVSQLRRPERFNDEPTLIDLKESGDIEAHAHIVLLIHSPLGDDGYPRWDEQKIILAKNRNGIRCSIPVRLNEQKLLFQPRDTTHV